MDIIQRLRMPAIPYKHGDIIRQLQAIAPNNFVVWKYQPGSDKKPPFWVNGNILKGTHTTWENYADVYTPYIDGRFAGIGFVLTHTNVICIDIDDCIVDGVILPYAQVAIDTLRTYTEISPSGSGIKIFGTYDAEMQKTGHWVTPSDVGTIEVYNGRGGAFHYMTLTGDHVETSPAKLNVIKFTNYRSYEKAYRADFVAATINTAPATSRGATLIVNAPPQVPTPATVPATASTTPATTATDINDERRIKRFEAWLPKYWASIKSNAETSLQGAAQWHDARRRVGISLGTTLGALQHAATTINASAAWLPTIDVLAAEIYKMRKNDDNQTDTKNEQRTIETAVKKGYYTGINDYTKASGKDGNPPEMLIHIINDTGHETPATSRGATLIVNAPPQVPTPATAPATASIFDVVYNFVAEDDYYNSEGELLQHTGHTIAENYNDLDNDKIRKPKPVIANAGSNQHLVMEGTTILSAKSKAGKSTVVLHLAYCVSIGAVAVFGTPSFTVPTSGKVIFFDLENDEGLTADRMREMGLTNNPNFIHIRASTWEQWLHRGEQHGVTSWGVLQSLIGHYVTHYDDIRMIVIDNVLAFEPVPKKGETAGDIERKYLMWLRSMAKHYRISVLLVDHNTKAQAGDNEALVFSKGQGTFRKAALLSGGSITIYDAPEKEKDRGQYKVATAPRGTKALTFFLRRDDVVGHHVVSDVQEDLDSVTEAQRRVLDAIRRGASKMIDIKLYCDPLAEVTIKKALSALIAQSLIERSSHGEYTAVEKAAALITPPQVPTMSAEAAVAFDTSLLEAIQEGYTTQGDIISALPGIKYTDVAIRLASLTHSGKLHRTSQGVYSIIGT